jgi:hypothetical protein
MDDQVTTALAGSMSQCVREEIESICHRYMNYYDVWEPGFNKENILGLVCVIKEGLR